MDAQSDAQLLRAYAERRSDAAFAELVRRHIDLVHSAARRMVGDAHIAEDVTQATFLALAKNAAQLTERPVLAGWLHRTAQNIAAQTVRTDVRRRAREQEAAAMNESLAASPDADWEQIAPHLDAALGELTEPERDAVMLRYFQRQTARDMAQTLGISDEAAQKRVSRAVDHLREFLTKRGVTVGASGLAVVISANAVQAAPMGLALTISTAAALTGTTFATTATVTATKAIAMTTLQKTIVTATIAVLAGTGIYEACQNARLRNRIQTLEQQQESQDAQMQDLQTGRDTAISRLTSLETQNRQSSSNQNSGELLKLRGEIAQLQRQLGKAQSTAGKTGDPFTESVLGLTQRAGELNQLLERMPEKKIPELQLLAENDWLEAAKFARLDSDENIRKSLSKLRARAKQRMVFGDALAAFTEANNGDLPAELSQLKPWFNSVLSKHGVSLDESTLNSIFSRYTLLHTGNVRDFPVETWFIDETASPADKDYDSRARFGIHRSTIID